MAGKPDHIDPAKEPEVRDEAAAEQASPSEDAGGDVKELTRGIDRLAEAMQQFAGAVQESTRSADAGPALGGMMAAPDLSVYRTITAARGVQETNQLLAQGWEFIGAEYCEEVWKRRGVGAKNAVIAWTLYAVLGKREALVESDRHFSKGIKFAGMNP